MRTRQTSCCFTGHRPAKLPWGYREEDPRCADLKRRIADGVYTAYEAGYRHFLCGMALGCDLYFCDTVLRLRVRHPEVTLEAAIPCADQADAWPAPQRQRYAQLVMACDYQTVLSPSYSAGCMHRRDRYMVDRSSLLIAAFDGTPGGTQYTVQYALKQGISIVDLPIVVENWEC